METDYFFAHPLTYYHALNPDRHTHVHNHVELIYCLKGEGYQITPGGLEPFSQGDLFYYLAGEPHLSYCTEEQSFDLAAIYFNEQYFLEQNKVWYGQLQDKWQKNGSRRLILADDIRVEQDLNIRGILREFEHLRPGGISAARSRLVLLLTDLLSDRNRSCLTDKSLSSSDKIGNLLHYIEVNYQLEMSVDFARDFCHMSRSRFHALFREKTGMGYVEYLNRIRIDRAGTLLNTQPAMAILTIAESCGFNEISHFCHLFKRFKGCSPREWRRMFLNSIG